jgi:hypothetical protein
MHQTAATYAPRLKKRAIKKHQISVQGDIVALLIKSIYVTSKQETRMDRYISNYNLE